MSPRNRKTNWQRILVAGSLCLFVAFSAGCGKKKEQKKPSDDIASTATSRPAPRRPVEPAPAPVSLTMDDLRFEMRLDKRVIVDPDRKVDNREQAEAALRFAEAFVKGDNEALAGMLAEQDRKVLQDLVNDGQWQAYTAGISNVAILSLDSVGNGFTMHLGINGSSLLDEAWSAESDGKGGYIFSAMTDVTDWTGEKNMQDLIAYYQNGGTDVGAAGNAADPEALRKAVQDAMKKMLKQEGGDDNGDKSETETPEYPTFNPAHRIRKRFYPGG